MNLGAPDDRDALRAIERETAYAEWLARASGQRRSRERAFDVLRILDLDPLPPLLGVVGSKGKGTTALAASALLSASGLRVGTVFSPGLSSNRDRLRLDGVSIEEAPYDAVLREVRDAALATPARDDGYLSPVGFFLLAGLRHFTRAHCDVVVVEAGIGGASDEISLLPLTGLAVTEIFLEHQALLGDTLAEIARDKAAAATVGTRFIDLLRQSPEATREIVTRASAIGATARIIDADERDGADPAAAGPRGFGARNTALGIAAADDLRAAMGLRPAPGTSRRAVAARVRMPGRLSLHRSGGARVLVDAAITKDGLDAALAEARREFGGDPHRVLVSIPADKDLRGFLAALADLPSERVFVDLPETHLPYPARADWPYAWSDMTRIGSLLDAPTVLAVGTAIFVGGVVSALGVDTDRLYDAASLRQA